MGYCGIKIPGHTGTDFKHKKAFKKSIYNLKKEKRASDVKTVAREKTKSNPWLKYLHFTIALGFLAIFCIVTFFFFLRIGQTPHKNFYTTSTKKYTYDREAQRVLYGSANLFYINELYDHAQEEAVRLLKVNPKEMKNIKLMHSILEKQCETKNIFCKEAEEYCAYLDLMKKTV